MNDAATLWTHCSEALRHQVSDATWQAWFAGLLAEGLEDGVLTVSTPNALVRDRLEDRYLGLLEGVLADADAATVKLRIVARPPAAAAAEEDPAPPAPAVEAPATVRAADVAPQVPDRGPAPVLNPTYTFEAFVIGATNRFAHAAAQRVAEKPAASYNPLFIYGDSGLGKTHLLHAIGHYVADNFPTRSVRYVSTETFMNDFVDAIRTNGQQTFKRRYRDCDVLLVDDIQFMEG